MSVAPEIKVHRSLTKALRIFDADRFRWLDEAAALGPLVALRMGPVKTWVVTDPDLARSMLVSDHASWIRPPTAVVPIRVAGGENLFTQPDEAWTTLQPLVAPAFRKRALDARLREIDAIVDDDVGAIPFDSTIDLELAMGRIALRLAAWVLLGEMLDPARAEEIAHHQRAVVGWVGARLGQLTGIVPIALGAKGRAMKRHRAVLHAYADEVIARAERNDHTGDDVLGALLHARPGGRTPAPDELRGHVLGLFLAGNETTGAALTWALVHGARAPLEWAKLRDPSRCHVLPFIDETLRVSPAVWGIPRTPAKPGLTLTAGGVTTRVRRGQIANVYLRAMHRDRAVWKDPLRFDPSRHESGGHEGPRHLLPFGLGPRGCIGQHLALAEMAAIVPALACRGDVSVDEPVVEDPVFALRVGGGLKGRLTQRCP